MVRQHSLSARQLSRRAESVGVRDSPDDVVPSAMVRRLPDVVTSSTETIRHRSALTDTGWHTTVPTGSPRRSVPYTSTKPDPAWSDTVASASLAAFLSATASRSHLLKRTVITVQVVLVAPFAGRERLSPAFQTGPLWIDGSRHR